MIGKVKYVGKTFGVEQLTNNKVYNVVSVEEPFIRIIDDSGEDYLYSISKPSSLEQPNLSGKWVIVEDDKNLLRKYIKNIDVFKDIKYNNPGKWKMVKSYVGLSRKGEMPSTLNLNKYVDNMQNKNWEAVDFSPKRVDAHVDKHLSEFGDITKEEYIDNARKLLNTKISEDILGFTNENGFVFRYDKNKNEFATSKPSGIIETYYKPKRSMEYLEEQVEKYENKKDV